MDIETVDLTTEEDRLRPAGAASRQQHDSAPAAGKQAYLEPVTSPAKKRPEADLEEGGGDDDPSVNCTICLEALAERGEHRPAALRCGHIFGEECIKKWLEQKRRCPQCNKRAVSRDVTPLYNLPKVAGVDTGYNVELERKLEQAKQEKEKAKSDAEKLQKELQRLQQQLRGRQGPARSTSPPSASPGRSRRASRWPSPDGRHTSSRQQDSYGSYQHRQPGLMPPPSPLQQQAPAGSGSSHHGNSSSGMGSGYAYGSGYRDWYEGYRSWIPSAGIGNRGGAASLPYDRGLSRHRQGLGLPHGPSVPDPLGLPRHGIPLGFRGEESLLVGPQGWQPLPLPGQPSNRQQKQQQQQRQQRTSNQQQPLAGHGVTSHSRESAPGSTGSVRPAGTAAAATAAAAAAAAAWERARGLAGRKRAAGGPAAADGSDGITAGGSGGPVRGRKHPRMEGSGEAEEAGAARTSHRQVETEGATQMLRGLLDEEEEEVVVVEAAVAQVAGNGAASSPAGRSGGVGGQLETPDSAGAADAVVGAVGTAVTLGATTAPPGSPVRTEAVFAPSADAVESMAPAAAAVSAAVAAAGAGGPGEVPAGLDAAAGSMASAIAGVAGTAAADGGGGGGGIRSSLADVLGPAAASGRDGGGGGKQLVLEVVPPSGVASQGEPYTAAVDAAAGYHGYFNPLQWFKIVGGRAFHLDPMDKMVLIGESMPDGGGRPRLRKVSMVCPKSPEFISLPAAAGFVRCIHPQPSTSSSSGFVALGCSKGGLLLASTNSNNVVASIPVPGQLWSCCWNPSHEQQLLLGLDKGRIGIGDLRMPSGRGLLQLTMAVGPPWPQPLHTMLPVPVLGEQGPADGGGGFLVGCTGGVYHWQPDQPASFRQLLPSSLHGGTCESVALDPTTHMLAASFRSSSSGTSWSAPAAHWLYKLGWEEGEEARDMKEQEQQQQQGQGVGPGGGIDGLGQSISRGASERTPLGQQQQQQGMGGQQQASQWHCGQTAAVDGVGQLSSRWVPQSTPTRPSPQQAMGQQQMHQWAYGQTAAMASSTVLGLLTRSPVVSWEQKQQQQQLPSQVLGSSGVAAAAASCSSWQTHSQQQQLQHQTPIHQQQQHVSDEVLRMKNIQQLTGHASSQVMTTGCFLGGRAGKGPWFASGDEASCCPWVWDCGEHQGRGRVLQRLEGLGVGKPLIAVAGEMAGCGFGAYGLLGALSESSLIVYDWVDASGFENQEY